MDLQIDILDIFSYQKQDLSSKFMGNGSFIYIATTSDTQLLFANNSNGLFREEKHRSQNNYLCFYLSKIFYFILYTYEDIYYFLFL